MMLMIILIFETRCPYTLIPIPVTSYIHYVNNVQIFLTEIILLQENISFQIGFFYWFGIFF